MTKECPNDEGLTGTSGFVINSSFVIRISSFLHISSRLEPGRALSFSDGARDGSIAQLTAVDGAAKEQAAPAHVASADEIARETESRAEMLEKNVDVLRGGNAAEQNDFGICRQFFRESLHVALERGAVTRIVFVNVDRGELAEIRETDRARGRNEAARRRNHEDRRTPAPRRREGIRVGEFSPEIEAA